MAALGDREGCERVVVIAKQRVERDDEDLVRCYLTDVGRHGLLSKDDEVRLAQLMDAARLASVTLADGGKTISASERRRFRRSVLRGAEAHDEFVVANLRLVVSIAKRYQWSGVPLLDLIQEGNLGLIHAVDKFDWRKGFKFSTYATWWIRQAISRGIANTGRTIRLPVHADDLLGVVGRVRSDLEAKLGRVPTRGELAAALDVSEAKLSEVMCFAAAPRSLSEPLADDSTGEFGDLIEDRSQPSPCDTALVGLLVGEVAAMLGALDEREQRTISLRFGLDCGEPRTLEEVGREFHITRERVRQIELLSLIHI